ncbi:hypothetical protein GALMADRAFT_570605 [Galerina marginata CBS 339.88]|uniref:Uncharacterized protein n=1 Tax=Galerina marginata (strain CBS 339.88) TaxID=685588 RepID=A0A067SVS9_GALM3|nr:hypothetical protein GALMADRAFT_570605 [Galerina marginata CBS 339.88]
MRPISDWICTDAGSTSWRAITNQPSTSVTGLRAACHVTLPNSALSSSTMTTTSSPLSPPRPIHPTSHVSAFHSPTTTPYFYHPSDLIIALHLSLSSDSSPLPPPSLSEAKTLPLFCPSFFHNLRSVERSTHAQIKTHPLNSLSPEASARPTRSDNSVLKDDSTKSSVSVRAQSTQHRLRDKARVITRPRPAMTRKEEAFFRSPTSGASALLAAEAGRQSLLA